MQKPLWKKELFVASTLAIISIGGLAWALETCGDVYCNPLGSVTDFAVLVKNILTYAIQVIIPLAGLSIIIAGFFYLYAAVSGNTSKTQQARKIFYYVVLGTAIVVGAAAIANAVIDFLKNPR